uniref:multiple organellar RNA editing factor 2, chloroplastic-like n=1 Tax=Erigeron canadensis TaxID=72917 RepID=UPI001CB8C8A7|nr:multiple organellar RNA editing factor 2, chloroplastic-like [Erigeron canadensis]
MAASAIGRSVLKFRSSAQILKPSPFLLHSFRPFSADSVSHAAGWQPMPEYDLEHWNVHVERPGGVGSNKQQKIDCYIQTLAMVLGSEEEAKKKIYKINLGSFGCEIDEETSRKIIGLPGVTSVGPDLYFYKDVNELGGSECL